MVVYQFIRSRDSVVGIATSYRLGDRGFGVRVPAVSRIFSSLNRPDRLWGPPNLLSNGHQGLFPGGKAAEPEVDHSPPTSAKVKKMWIYTCTPIRLQLVKHNDYFTFFLPISSFHPIWQCRYVSKEWRRGSPTTFTHYRLLKCSSVFVNDIFWVLCFSASSLMT
jgi:hypothetical protein